MWLIWRRNNMGLFNGKEVGELVLKTNENTNEIMAVKRDLETNKYEIESFKIESEEKIKLILDEVMEIKKSYSIVSEEHIVITNRCNVLENEKLELQKELEEALQSQKIKGEYMTFDDVSKSVNISGFKTAELKYYLHENGVMNMTINNKTE